MPMIMTAVDWVDDEVCQTRIEGSRSLPEGAVAELHRWTLALELGCSTEDLDRKGWQSCPDESEYLEGFGWILSWNRL